MDEKKYVAYVGTYTHGSSVGIHLFDPTNFANRWLIRMNSQQPII